MLLSTSPSSIPLKYPAEATSPRDYWIGNAEQTQALREAMDARMRQVVADMHAQGHRVSYVKHDIPADTFLDDAHLTPAGNVVLAREFCDALAAVVPMGANPRPRP